MRLSSDFNACASILFEINSNNYKYVLNTCIIIIDNEMLFFVFENKCIIKKWLVFKLFLKITYTIEISITFSTRYKLGI